MTTSAPWVDNLTIGQMLKRTAQRVGSRDALVFPQALFRATWAEFDAAVDHVARGLLALGFQKGEHFGVWSTNWPEWVILQFATARIGVAGATPQRLLSAAEVGRSPARVGASRPVDLVGTRAQGQTDSTRRFGRPRRTTRPR